MKLHVGPTGNLVKGSILDVSVNTLERLMKHIDPQLYIKWNPTRNKGMGVWELRRLPNTKSIKYSTTVDNNTIHFIDYVEYDVENHIWDMPVLGYDQLDRLRAADTWAVINFEANKLHRVHQFTQQADDNFYNRRQEEKDKARSEMLYNLMQDKKAFRGLQDAVASGADPSQIARVWKKR